MRHVFIIGSKGIPARYGGFETFVDRLTKFQKSKTIKYHVACMGNAKQENFEHQGADCFVINVPNIGPAKAVYYDLAAMRACIRYIRKNHIEDSVLYILACRIGPFMRYHKRVLEKLGCVVLVNPDGHEWMRAKWNAFIKKYWKYSERLMVKYCDGLICDSVNIEKYIQSEYSAYRPATCFIPYGADNINEMQNTQENERKLVEWLSMHEVEKQGYYLIVGRFVPENNYAIAIREIMQSKSTKKLVLITNVEQNKYYQRLKDDTNFEQDSRICFPGTVYDAELLGMIRKNAFAYIHGHEVGGTNPSLLEAMANTNLNLLLDVSFNKEVGADAAVYWTKEEGSLCAVLEEMEEKPETFRMEIGKLAKQRIIENYTWDMIVSDYEKVFEKRNVME